VTPSEWAAKVAAGEAAGLLKHGLMTFLKTDRAPPPGRSGKVWADAGGHGFWIADRKGMTLLEMRNRM
jgi:hypothetical protein